MALTFKWDEAKAKTNLAKHGVAFVEAATIFGDDQSLTIPDPDHSLDEERFITLGRSDGENALVVVHTQRGPNLRIISARKASKKERTYYEKASK